MKDQVLLWLKSTYDEGYKPLGRVRFQKTSSPHSTQHSTKAYLY